jgi:hypothetical protein
VIFLITLAGRAVPVAGLPDPLPEGLLPRLMKTNVSTMAITTTLPPAIRTRRRAWARRARACWAATFARAFCVLVR